MSSLFVSSLVEILSSETSQTDVGHVGRSEQDAVFYTREMQ